MARSSTTFKPGICYNRAGRKSGIGDIRELARTFTHDAIKTLASIMNNPDAKESCRIAAASELITRGWGKPEQAIHFTPLDTFDVEKMTTPQLYAMLQECTDARTHPNRLEDLTEQD